MGHSIQHYTFDLTKDKREIQGFADEEAAYESDSRSGLNANIRFLDSPIYEDRDAAEIAIKKLDKGWYDQLAVKFNDFDKVKDTKAIINLVEKIKKARVGITDYKEKNAIKLRKSQFVGCTKCGSKINKEYVSDSGYNWNKCPLCGEDLSSDTIKKTIINKEKAISELEANYADLRKQNAKKGKKTVKWLVKTEYHI